MRNLLASSDLLTLKQILFCVLLQVTLIPIVAGLLVGSLNVGRRHAVLLGVLLLSLVCPLLVTICHVGGVRFPIAVASTSDSASPSAVANVKRGRRMVESTVEASAERPETTDHEPNASIAVEPAKDATKELVMPVAAGRADGAVEAMIGWFEALLCAWVAGMLLGVLRLFAGWYWLRRVLARVTELPVPARVTRAISAIFSNQQPVRLYESSSTTTPNVTGVWRPVIVLPQGIMERLSSEELTAVVTHEYAHARRADCAIGLMQRFAAILYWFPSGRALVESTDHGRPRRDLR